MRKIFITVLLFSYCFASGAVDLFTAADFKKFYPVLSGNATSVYTENGFTVNVTNQTSGFVAIQMMATVNAPINEGDILYLKFKARCAASSAEDAKGAVTAYLQENLSPWRKCFTAQVKPSAQWREYTIPFAATRNHLSGKSAICFGYGGSLLQTIEIKEISLVNYAAEMKIADLPKTLEGSVNIVEISDVRKFGKPSASLAEFTYTDTGFTVKVINGTGDFFTVQSILRPQAAIGKRDILYLKFKARCTRSLHETNEGYMVAYFQEDASPWGKSLSSEVSPNSEWKEYLLPFLSAKDYAAGESNMCFGFGGFGEQTIEVKDITLTNYFNGVDITALPSTSFAYKGIEEDAPWRAEADERIDKYRKNDIYVAVNSQNQSANLDGAKLEIELVRHAFPFGSVASMTAFNGDVSGAYKKHFLENFNSGGTENAMKWNSAGDAPFAYPTNRAPYNFLNWAKSNDIFLRGHVLLWGSWKHLPAKAADYKTDAVALKNYINKHVDDITAHFKSWVNEWDVLNEPYNNTEIADVVGEDYYIELFKRARTALPDASLYLNDYGILSSASATNPHADYVYNLAKKLVDNNAGITGVGLQSHFGATLTPPVRVYEILNRFATLGLTLKITEFDIDNIDESLQAAFTRDFLTICFSHPKVVGFQMWGFWSKAHWKPNCAMFGDDWTPRKHAIAWKELIYSKWHTRYESMSPKFAKIRGFKGTYKLRLTLADKRVVEKTFQLGDEPVNIDINCSADPETAQTACEIAPSTVGENTYAKWAGEKFGAELSEKSLMYAKPNGDGITNLEKYALAINPAAPQSAPLNYPVKIATDAKGRKLVYSANKSAKDVKITPLWSTDLKTWNESMFDVQAQNTDDANVEIRTATASVDNPQVFYKIKIEKK